MLTKILVVAGLAVIVFLIFVALQPSHFRIERSAVIAAPAAEIFPHVNDLKKAQAWSPWIKFDPAAKFTFEGPATGNGASSTWSGNSKIGEGRQTIVESRPNEMIKIKLDFVRPFKSTCAADFTLKPEGWQTRVTWGMSGEANFLSKLFCVFVNQDKMVGGEFEDGLAKLKTLAEGATVAAK